MVTMHILCIPTEGFTWRSGSLEKGLVDRENKKKEKGFINLV